MVVPKERVRNRSIGLLATLFRRKFPGFHPGPNHPRTIERGSSAGRRPRCKLDPEPPRSDRVLRARTPRHDARSRRFDRQPPDAAP
jgi:hypothetical protein